MPVHKFGVKAGYRQLKLTEESRKELNRISKVIKTSLNKDQKHYQETKNYIKTPITIRGVELITEKSNINETLISKEMLDYSLDILLSLEASGELTYLILIYNFGLYGKVFREIFYPLFMNKPFEVNIEDLGVKRWEEIPEEVYQELNVLGYISKYFIKPFIEVTAVPHLGISVMYNGRENGQTYTVKNKASKYITLVMYQQRHTDSWVLNACVDHNQLDLKNNEKKHVPYITDRGSEYLIDIGYVDLEQATNILLAAIIKFSLSTVTNNEELKELITNEE